MAMKIDLYQRKYQRPSSQPGRYVDPTAFSSGDGFRAIGSSVEKIGEIMRRAEDAERSADVSRLSAQFQLETGRYFDERSTIYGGYKDLVNDISTDFQERKQKLLDSIDDEKTRAALDRELVPLYVTTEAKARKEARSQYVSWVKAAGDEALQSNIEAGIEAKNIFELDAARSRIIRTVNDMATKMMMSPDDSSELMESSIAEIYENRARRQMIDDPETVMEQINDRELYPYLDEDTRTKLMIQAQKAATQKARRDEIEEARIERETERKLKAEREENSVKMFQRLNDKQIDYDGFYRDLDTLARRRKLKDDDYRRLRKAAVEAQRGGGESEPELYREIATQVYSGQIDNPGQVWDLAGRGLSLKDVQELSKAAQEGAPIFKTRDYQEAVKHLASMLGSAGGLAILKPNESVRIGRATRELYFRVKGGEKPWSVVDEMLPRYMSIPDAELPKPRFPDEKQAVDAFAAGTIDKQSLDREIQLLKMWQNINSE